MQKQPTFERFWRADIERPPDSLTIGRGDLDASMKEWIQPLDRWTMLLYRHQGRVHLNVHAYDFEPGTMVLIPPGCHARHHRIGENTPHHYATFHIAGRYGNMNALPVTWQSSAEMQDAFEMAAQAVARSHERSFAYVWFQLWHVAKPISVFRSNNELYDAEAYIQANLSRKLRTEEIAHAANASTRTLLRLFNLEHGMTIVQFIRHRRLQEAIRLLTETSLPLKVVASRVGVPDSHQFNKLLRYATGVSPGAYRRTKS